MRYEIILSINNQQATLAEITGFTKACEYARNVANVYQEYALIQQPIRGIYKVNLRGLDIFVAVELIEE
jgi:hypothetical protein